jgi:hypothetical protein
MAVMLAATLLACGKQDVVRSQATAQVTAASASQMSGPYAPAGSKLTVVLDATLSAVSPPREPFTATTESELLTADGRVLVRAGARVTGHVVGAKDGGRPQLVLAFDTVETPLGSSPIVATILDVKAMRSPASNRRVEREFLSSPSTPAPPPNVPITSPFPDTPPAVLPTGARLRLELTRPLVLSGSVVGR